MKNKILVVDPFGGASGDMWLGALVDAGAPLPKIKRILARLRLRGWTMRSSRARRLELSARRVEVAAQRHGGRSFSQAAAIVRKAALSGFVTERSLRVLEDLARAEARVHGESVKRGRFDLLGDDDTLLDVVGTIAALELLSVADLFSTPVGIGWGNVRHGGASYPAESPVSMELLKGFPVRPAGEPGERVTPTGAALLRALAKPRGSWPEMTLETVGYGAGQRRTTVVPNVLRVWLGSAAGPGLLEDRVLVAEAHIDDGPPLVYEPLMDRLFEAGALDVALSPLQMKKNRPALKLTVLLDLPDLDRIGRLIFEETTTLGFRYYEVLRRKLRQETGWARLSGGRVRVKLGYLNGELLTASPEYEDCRRLAQKRGAAFKTVYQEAQSKILDNTKKDMLA